MKHHTEVPIPIVKRQEYLSGESLTCVLVDSKGKKQAVWPSALEVPTRLLINFSPHGHVESMRCEYLKDLGFSDSYFLAAQKFFFRVHQESGVLHRFGFISPPVCGPSAYFKFLDLMERMVDCAKIMPDDFKFKWKLIFSTQLVYDEWREHKAALKELLSTPPLR